MDGRTFDSAKVKIELVEIPYVQLRERLPVNLIDRRASFAELLHWTQEQIAAWPQTPVLQIVRE